MLIIVKYVKIKFNFNQTFKLKNSLLNKKKPF